MNPWIGLSDKERLDLWKTKAEVVKINPQDAKPTDSVLGFVDLELSFNVLQELNISAETKMAVARMLQCEFEINGTHPKIAGSAFLLAYLFTWSKDEKLSLGVYLKIVNHLQYYLKDAPIHINLHNDLLLLADLLCVHVPSFAKALNEQSIEVFDLSDIYKQWSCSLFSTRFPSDIVLRICDILLSEGIGSCVFVAYFLAFCHDHKAKLLDPSSTILNQLPNVALGLKKDLDKMNMCETAYKLVKLKSKEVVELRSKKDWSKMLDLNVEMPFVEGVGSIEIVNKLIQEQISSQLMTPQKHKVTFHLERASSPHIQAAIFAEGKNPSSSSQSQDLDQQLDGETREVQTLLEELTKKLHDGPFAKSNTKKNEQTDTLEDLQKLAEKVKNAHSQLIGTVSSLREFLSSQNPSQYESQGRDYSSSLSFASAPQAPSVFQSSWFASATNALRKPPAPSGYIKTSEISDFQTFPCAVMEGYLNKCRAASSMRKIFSLSSMTIKPAYFVLTGSFLTHFKNHEARKSSHDRYIDLRTCKVELVEKHPFGEFGFSIKLILKDKEEHLFTLFAVDKETRDVWFNLLQAGSHAK